MQQSLFYRFLCEDLLYLLWWECDLLGWEASRSQKGFLGEAPSELGASYGSVIERKHLTFEPWEGANDITHHTVTLSPHAVFHLFGEKQ